MAKTTPVRPGYSANGSSAKRTPYRPERTGGTKTKFTYFNKAIGEEVTIDYSTGNVVRSTAVPVSDTVIHRQQGANESDAAYKRALEEASSRSAAQANLLQQQRQNTQDIRNNPNQYINNLIDQYNRTMASLEKGNMDNDYAARTFDNIDRSSRDLTAQMRLAGYDMTEVAPALSGLRDNSQLLGDYYNREAIRDSNQLDNNAGQMQFLNTLTEEEKLEYFQQHDPARAESMLENMEQRSKNWADIYRKQLEELNAPEQAYGRYGEGAATALSAAEKGQRNAEIRALENRLAEAESDYAALSNREWYSTMMRYPAEAVYGAWRRGDTAQVQMAWDYLSATDPTKAMEQAQQIVSELEDERFALGQQEIDRFDSDAIEKRDAQLTELSEQINEWNERLHKATYQMEGVRMADVSVEGSDTYDPRFTEFSQYNSIGEYLEPEQMNEAGRIYEYINNEDPAYRMRLTENTDTMTGIPEMRDFTRYDLLTDEEKSVFNYYFTTDSEKAMAYLDSLEETLNYRAAVEDYKENWKGKPWKEALLGAWQSGLNQYQTGAQSFVSMLKGDEYIPTTKGEYMSGMMREDLANSGSKWADLATGAYDMGVSVSNMLPSVLINTLIPSVGGKLGAVGKVIDTLTHALPMGTSVAGNAYKEAVNKGFDPSSASLYAAGIGATEVFLQNWIGGISQLSGAKNITDKAVASLLGKVDNAVARAALKLGLSGLGEGAEEYMQEIIAPVMENLLLGAHNDIDLISEDAIYSGIIGFFSAMPFNIVAPGPDSFSANLREARRENLIAESSRSRAAEIVEEAKLINADSDALARVEKQLESGGAENVSRRDLALLVRENNQITRKDMRDNGTAAAKAEAPERTVAINKNGTATTSDGEAVTVRGVAYKDGNVLVRIADESGAETNVSRSTLNLSEDVADLVSLAEKYDTAAPAVYAAYDNSMDFDRYASDVEYVMAIAKGSVGVNGEKALTWLKNNESIKLEPVAIDALFQAGREIGINEQPLIRRGSGNVTFAQGINRKNLNSRQRRQVSFMEYFAKLVGVDVEFFMSTTDGEHYIGENGSYINNRIRIDLNAGLYHTTDDVAKIAITRTASHELTHWLKDIAPKEYMALRNFVVAKMIDEGGGTLQDLIDQKKRRASGDLTTDEAIDEIVADGCELMLGKSEYIREYAAKNAKGFEAIKNWLKKFLAKLKAAFKGVDSAHQESVVLMEKYADELLAMWDNALKAGLENPATAPISESAKTEVEAKSAAKIGIDVDAGTESVAPAELHSERTWTESDYVTERNKAAAEIAKAIGVTEQKAKDYIDDVNSIARMIAEDRTRLDYFSSPFRSSFISNVEYGGSFDFSTLCKKRRLLTGTFTAIQKALPNTALTANEILDIRNRMKEAGLEVSCGLCYVEGSRANMGQFSKEFLRLYKQYYPDAWQPNMVDVNTPDGVEWMRLNHPEAYEQYEYFWNHYGTLKPGDKNLFASQQKPKLYQLHTEYKGEILSKFTKEDNIEAKNKNGGIRLQSFSDFEIVHLIDCMQIIMDMSRVGLAGQAYTKVPDFAWALGDTGLKINLSLIAKGVDENGKLIFDDVEGMPIAEAMKLRDRYSANVGTILVAFNDEQLLAAMADDRVDFIIPFHRSQWKKSQYTAMGLPAKTKDYTFMQNEKFIKPQYHEYRGRMVKDKATNYMPNEYWDFSKSGKENAEAYLAMCAANNKRPKFYKLLQNNGDGSFSLKADGSTDGYWKLLIDFKMYDNDGVGSTQLPVRPEFNMAEANRMLNEYRGGHSQFPVAQGIVDDFVSQYKAEHKGEKFSAREQFSVRHDIVDVNGKEYDSVVMLDKRVSKRTMSSPRLLLAYIEKNFAGKRIPVVGANGEQEIIEFAKRGEVAQKSKNSHPVLGELGYARGETKKLIIVNSMEVVSESTYDPIYSNTNSDHGWLAQKGWESRFAYVMDGSNTIYKAYLKIAKARDGRNIMYAVNVDVTKGIAVDKGATAKRAAVLAAVPSNRIVHPTDTKSQPASQNNSGPHSERDPLTEEITRLEQQIKKLEQDLEATKEKYRTSMGEARIKAKQKQENLEAQIKKLKRDSRDDLKEMREKLADLKKQDAKRLKDYRANRNESDAVKKYRRNVEKHVKELQDLLLTNTDKKHIPEPLKEPVARFLESLMPQMYSRSAYEKGTITNRDVQMLNTWNKLEDALRGQIDAQRGMGTEGKFEFEGYLDLPPEMMDEFKELKDNIGKLAENARLDDPLYQLSSADLQRLDWILKTIKHSVNQANQMLSAPKQSVLDASKSTIEAVAELGETKLPGKIGGTLGKFLTWDNTTPFYAFKRFGEGGKTIFNAIASGWDKLAFNSKAVIDFSESTYTEKEVKAWTEETHDFELESGKSVRMTEAQMMALYCLSKRPQAMGHLLGGGIRVANIEKGKNRIQQSEPRLLTLDDIEMIKGALTAHQREVADKIQRFMTDQGSEWGNEVSMKRFGYRAFTEDVYFPILSDQNNFAAIDAEAKANDLFRLLNISATKALTKEANNAIVIQGIFDVYAAHMSDMAKYNALALPVLDAFKWINYKEDTTNADGTRETVTVQRAMEKAYGKQAQQYLITFLKDLNAAQTGGRRDSGITNTFMSNAKVASVAANVRVALLQPTAYVKAANLINPKWLAAGAAMTPNQHKAAVNEMLKHSGIALWKDLGFYDTNIGRSLTEKIKHSESTKDKVLEKSMFLAEKGDQFTWGLLWNACKREIRATQHLRDDALIKATAERFREVVYATQVVDSTLTRSHIMRDKDGAVKMATSFMSEPTIAYNMLLDQYTEFVNEFRKTGSKGNAWQKTYKGIVRTAGVYAATAIATAIVESLTDIAREDEEKFAIWEKAFWKKYGKYLGGNLVSNLNPLNLVPILREISSAIEGFATERQDVSWIKDLIDAVQIVFEHIGVKTGVVEDPTKLTYYGRMTDYGVVYKALQALSTMTGLPISALTREAQALWNNSVGLFRENLLLKTYDAGDKADIQSAYSEGYISTEEAMSRLIATGMSENDAYWEVQKLDGVGKSDKLAAAIISGTGFQDAYEELNSRGYQRKDIDGMVSNLVRTWLQGKPSSSGKPYKGHRVDEKAAADLLVKYGNEDREDAEKKVLKWSMYVDTGHDYSEIEDLLLDGTYSEDDAIGMLMSYGSKDEDEAEMIVQAYLWRDENQAYADLPDQKIDRFIRYCEPTGIDIDEFYEASAVAADMKKAEIIDMILDLGLTAKQEEAMWNAIKQSNWKNTDTPWE